ncbi:MAG TPA: hypothetical protein VEK15_23405 [Vicinamibacteria bacterium]|nr:hypothetical protein [Vicinamibacteria bacterium]
MPHVARVGLAGTIFVLLTFAVEAEEKKTAVLPRSIYLPIEFDLCEHLHDAVLYEGTEAVSSLPVKRIFQFTYYPTLERIEPIRTDIEIVGIKDDGERFMGKLAVTPWGVFTAKEKVELDMGELESKLRHKIDVRYDTMTLRFRCEDRCQRGMVQSDEDENEKEPSVEKPRENRSSSW